MDLGVPNPSRLVSHARQWGSIEIFDYSQHG
jgi:hypothetical protein